MEPENHPEMKRNIILATFFVFHVHVYVFGGEGIMSSQARYTKPGSLNDSCFDSKKACF